MEERLPIPQIIIIIGTISALMVSYYELGGEIKMDVALVVAIIGVAGGLWAQVLQAFRVSGKIGDVGKKTSDVGEKVSGVGEKVNGVREKVKDVQASSDKLHQALNVTEENVKKIKDEVAEKIVPGIKTMTDGKVGIDALVEELNFQKRLKSSMSGGIVNPDYLLTGINGVYEENAKLMTMVQERDIKLQKAELTINALNYKVTVLEEENRSLKPEPEVEKLQGQTERSRNTKGEERER